MEEGSERRCSGPLEFVTTCAERRPLLYLSVLIALGAALRLPLLFDREPWLDEIYQWYISSGESLGDLRHRLIRYDRQPPAYTLLCAPLTHLGLPQASMRVVSLVLGLSAIPLGWLAGRSAGGARVGAIVAALVACNAEYVFFSREARPYALGIATVFLFLWRVRVALDRPTTRNALLCALAALAASCSQYASGLVAGAVLGWSLVWALGPSDVRRARVRCVGIALAVHVLSGVAFAAVCAVPQIRAVGPAEDQFAGNLYDIRQPGEAARFVAWESGQLLSQLVVTGRPLISGRYGAALLFAVVPLLALAATVRRDRDAAWIGGATAVAVAGFVTLAGVRVHPYGALRHCLPLTPLLLVAIAAGLVHLHDRVPRVGAFLAAACLLGLLVCSTIGAVVAERDRHNHDGAGLLAALRERVADGDVVVVIGQDACLGFVNQLSGDSDAVFEDFLQAKAEPDCYASAARVANGSVVFVTRTHFQVNVSFACPSLRSARRVWVVEWREGGRGDLSRADAAYTSADEIVRRQCRATLWRR